MQLSLSLCSIKQPLWQVVEHLSQTLVSLQSVTHFTAVFTMNLVTPNAAAKLELWFNKPASDSGLLNI